MEIPIVRVAEVEWHHSFLAMDKGIGSLLKKMVTNEGLFE